MKSFECNENFERVSYPGTKKYGIPLVKPGYDVPVTKWVMADHAMSQKSDVSQMGLHFYTDDYNFHRYWYEPDKYLPVAQSYKVVIAPDFSVYTDFPFAMNLYNTYRNAWLARYWQEHDVNVIPCVMWGDESSYEYCFDHWPKNTVVSCSSVGFSKSNEEKRLFLRGYNEMLKRLMPTKIIFYGVVPKDVYGPIEHVESFGREMKRRILSKGKSCAKM